MTTSFVTGGAGFIGSHLVEELVRRGRDVIVLDDLSNGRMDNLAHVKEEIVFHQRDITDGFDGIEGLSRASEVFHLACFPRQISFTNPTRDCQVNLMATILCAELVRRTGAKILYTSNTGIVSKPATLPVDETFSPNPLTPYDTHKLASEYILKAYSEFYGTKAVTVRFASVYGPRQHVNESLGWRPVIPEFATRLLSDQVPRIDGDGNQTRDFLYVKDAVLGVVQAMESESPEANSGDIFILGTNRETSIAEVFNLISRLLNATTEPTHGPRKAEDILRMRYDYQKAKRVFGFDPQISLEDGLAQTVGSLKREYAESH